MTFNPRYDKLLEAVKDATNTGIRVRNYLTGGVWDASDCLMHSIGMSTLQIRTNELVNRNSLARIYIIYLNYIKLELTAFVRYISFVRFRSISFDFVRFSSIQFDLVQFRSISLQVAMCYCHIFCVVSSIDGCIVCGNL